MLEPLNQWTLKDPIVSQRGAKSCPLTLDDGTAVIVQLGSKAAPVSSPFGASSYGDEASVRKTLEFSLEPEQAQFWDSVTEWLRGYLQTHSDRLMKKKLSAETISENLRPPAVQKNEYRPLLRTKLTISGSHAVRCWDEQGQKIDLPEDLRGVPLIARVCVERLWCMGRQMGLVLTCTDLQILDHAAVGSSCPFES